MKKTSQSKKEISLLMFAFVLIGFISIGIKYFEYYTIEQMSRTTTDIFDHPLKVSNTALTVKLDVYKMHRDMKDIVLSESKEEILELEKMINSHEKRVYKNLNIIEKNIIGKAGLRLEKKTKELFQTWKPIRAEVISLMNTGNTKKAIQITKVKGANHVIKLELSALSLYNYAQDKAIGFKNSSESSFKKLEIIGLLVSSLFLIILVSIGYYIVNRISNFMYSNEHLKGVLSVIRDINQLILREKNQHKLLQDSCDILVSRHVYASAMFIILDENDKIDYFVSSDKSSKFEQFKEKIDKNWLPSCVKQIIGTKKLYSILENNNEDCTNCPLASLYEDKSSFNIAIKHNEKVYGYLTIYIDNQYITNNSELLLLSEVADDIAYGLYNIEVEESLRKSENRYRVLFQGNRAIELIIDPKNGNIIDCNEKALNYYGYSYDKIINMSISEINTLSAKEIDTEMRLAVEQKRDTFNFQHILSNGEIRDVEVYAGPIEIESEVLIYSIIFDVTKKNEAERRLIYSKELYNNTINCVENLIFVKNIEGVYITCNNAFSKFVGRPKESIIGQTDFQLFDKELAYCFRENDKAMLDENRSKHNYEWVTYPDGTQKYLYTIKSPLLDSSGEVFGLVGNSADFTKTQNALDLVEQKKDELETVFNEAPTPMAIHNEDGDIIMINKVWEELTGYKYKQINTIEKWSNVVCSGNSTPRKEYIKNLYNITKRIEEGEFDIITKNGKKITWKFYSAPLGIVDGKRTIISSAMDITELKKKDEMLISQSRAAAMGEMIGMIAHQWRQPISVISMTANNMLLDIELESFDLKSAKEYSDNIIDQTIHLSKTIDDFRNFFKPDKTIVITDLKNIIDETYPIIKNSLYNNNIKYKFTYNSHAKVQTYPRELMQVFVNIITNAKDALVSSKIEKPVVEVNVFDDQTYVNTEIFNNAECIDTNIISKIFEPYFSTKDEKTGTGLGLYMSKMIIEEHLNGKIEVVNKNIGVCFTVKLPIIEDKSCIE